MKDSTLRPDDQPLPRKPNWLDRIILTNHNNSHQGQVSTHPGPLQKVIVNSNNTTSGHPNVSNGYEISRGLGGTKYTTIPGDANRLSPIISPDSTLLDRALTHDIERNVTKFRTSAARPIYKYNNNNNYPSESVTDGNKMPLQTYNANQIDRISPQEDNTKYNSQPSLLGGGAGLNIQHPLFEDLQKPAERPADIRLGELVDESWEHTFPTLPYQDSDRSPSPDGEDYSHQGEEGVEDKILTPFSRKEAVKIITERQKKIGHRRVDDEGKVTYKKVESSQLLKAIQLGLNHSIGSLSSKPQRDVLMQDFTMIEVVTFPKEGSSTTAAHEYSDFRFKTYAPVAFRYFRELFGIKTEDFLISLCAQPPRELSNPGASGSVFFVTCDDEFILKTVQRKEASFLEKLLPGYYMNLNQNPRTLLPKFFGLYCYQSGGKNIRLLIMNNLIPSFIKIHEKYDLKGSTYKRKASKYERVKANPTFKDLDFLEKHPQGIMLEAETYDALIKTLKRDCLVLESFKIMDYSLLMGIHNLDLTIRERELQAKEKQSRDRQNLLHSPLGGSITSLSPQSPEPPNDLTKINDRGGTPLGNMSQGSSNEPTYTKPRKAYASAMEAIRAPPPHRPQTPESLDAIEFEEHPDDTPPGGIPARNAQGERLLCFIGIIDILQCYEIKKKLEHTFKSIFHDGDTVSVHRPSFYAQRFKDFMSQKVFKKIPSPTVRHPAQATLTPPEGVTAFTGQIERPFYNKSYPGVSPTPLTASNTTTDHHLTSNELRLSKRKVGDKGPERRPVHIVTLPPPPSSENDDREVDDNNTPTTSGTPVLRREDIVPEIVDSSKQPLNDINAIGERANRLENNIIQPQQFSSINRYHKRATSARAGPSQTAKLNSKATTVSFKKPQSHQVSNKNNRSSIKKISPGSALDNTAHAGALFKKIIYDTDDENLVQQNVIDTKKPIHSRPVSPQIADIKDHGILTSPPLLSPNQNFKITKNTPPNAMSTPQSPKSKMSPRDNFDSQYKFPPMIWNKPASPDVVMLDAYANVFDKEIAEDIGPEIYEKQRLEDLSLKTIIPVSGQNSKRPSSAAANFSHNVSTLPTKIGELRTEIPKHSQTTLSWNDVSQSRFDSPRKSQVQEQTRHMRQQFFQNERLDNTNDSAFPKATQNIEQPNLVKPNTPPPDYDRNSSSESCENNILLPRGFEGVGMAQRLSLKMRKQPNAEPTPRRYQSNRDTLIAAPTKTSFNSAFLNQQSSSNNYSTTIPPKTATSHYLSSSPFNNNSLLNSKTSHATSDDFLNDKIEEVERILTPLESSPHLQPRVQHLVTPLSCNSFRQTVHPTQVVVPKQHSTPFTNQGISTAGSPDALLNTRVIMDDSSRPNYTYNDHRAKDITDPNESPIKASDSRFSMISNASYLSCQTSTGGGENNYLTATEGGTGSDDETASCYYYLTSGPNSYYDIPSHVGSLTHLQFESPTVPQDFSPSRLSNNATPIPRANIPARHQFRPPANSADPSPPPLSSFSRNLNDNNITHRNNHHDNNNTTLDSNYNYNNHASLPTNASITTPTANPPLNNSSLQQTPVPSRKPQSNIASHENSIFPKPLPETHRIKKEYIKKDLYTYETEEFYRRHRM